MPLALRLLSSRPRPLWLTPRAIALACGAMALVACTELKAVSVTVAAAASPKASAVPDSVAALSPSPASEAVAPVAPQPTSTPLVLPVPHGSPALQPVTAFTPAVIVPLGGLVDPAATKPALADPAATTAANAVPQGPATVPTLPGGTPLPTPVPGAPTPSPMPTLARISVNPSNNPFHVGGMAIDAANNLWLGDVESKVVRMYGLDGKIVGTFPLDGAPSALAFDASGRLWVQLSDLGTVDELDSNGNKFAKYALVAGGVAGATVAGLAATPGGGMWILNGTGVNLVTHLDATGAPGASIEAPGRVVALTADAAGNAWIVYNDTNMGLAKYSQAGTPLGTFTDLNGLQDPRALAIATDGTVWVAGRNTPVGQPTQGAVVGFAGTGVRQNFLSTGVGRQPVAIAFDAQGNLVLANGNSGGLNTVMGFQRLAPTNGQVLAETTYSGPLGVLTDRNGVFWGYSATEAVRFTLPGTH